MGLNWRNLAADWLQDSDQIIQGAKGIVPKSKTRKKVPGKSAGKKINFGANVRRSSARTYLIAGVVSAILVGYGGYTWWQSQQSSRAFSALSKQGRDALSRVETQPSQGGGHLSLGQSITYDSQFPTSGKHAPSPIAPGFYASELPSVGLVHSLEHGNIVIYYEDPGADAIRRLKDWTSLFGGKWDGVLATPSPGLGEAVVLTAWNRLLRLEKFDAAAAAAFIDAYRGRGPESPVR